MSIGLMNAVSVESSIGTKAERKNQSSKGTEKSFEEYLRTGKVSHKDGTRSVFADKTGELKNRYFLGEKNGFVEYNGVQFRCNHFSGALELGDTSNPLQCIRVPLEGGGSLLFNPDNISGVSKAIGMFSAEDQGRIMRAIQMYNMAKHKLEELEEDENAAPEEPDEADCEKDTSANESDETVLQDELGIVTDYMTELKERTDSYAIYDVFERQRA